MLPPAVTIGGSAVKTFSKCVQEISVKAGGYSRFTLEMVVADGYTEADLTRLFDTWLMKELIARKGAITWHGLVYEMTLLQNGYPTTLSMWEVYNRVNVFWRSPYADTFDTGWIDHLPSQLKYGVIEATNTPRGVFVGERAEAYAKGLLGNHAYPNREYGMFQGGASENGELLPGETKLTVVAVGWATHANRQYVYIPPPPDDPPPDYEPPEVNISAYVRQLITASPYLRIGNVVDTTATIVLEENNITNQYVPLWDHLVELAARASNEFHPWDVAAYADGRVFFGPVPIAPRFEWRDKPYLFSGNNPEWGALPGICRDRRSPIKGKQPDDWRESASDVWVDTIVCDMTKDQAELTYAPFDEDHISASIWGDFYYGG